MNKTVKVLYFGKEYALGDELSGCILLYSFVFVPTVPTYFHALTVLDFHYDLVQLLQRQAAMVRHFVIDIAFINKDKLKSHLPHLTKWAALVYGSDSNGPHSLLQATRTSDVNNW